MRTGTASFRELFGNGQRVEIPVIQRDYAQGRDDERSQDVRARFVKELAAALLAERTSPLDRDASWKRLLRADTRVADREARRDIVQRVFGRIDPKDVVSSLRGIIAAGVQGSDTSPLPGYRTRLVTNPRLIDYCGLRMVRFEEGTAFLLGRVQRNGHHVDLYVYDLYLRLQDRLAELAPFDAIECREMTGIYPPSQVMLRAMSAGIELSTEKHGASLQLQLHVRVGTTRLASELADWHAEGEDKLQRVVGIDEAEDAIVALTGTLRSLGSQWLVEPQPQSPGDTGAGT